VCGLDFGAGARWHGFVLAVQRVRAFDHAAGGDFPGIVLVPGLDGASGTRGAAGRKMVGHDGGVDWRHRRAGRIDAVFVWLADSSSAGLFRALLRAASRVVVPCGVGRVRRLRDAVAGAELQYVRNTVRHGGLRDCAGYTLTLGRPPGTFVKTQLRRLVAARLSAEAVIER